MRKADAWIRNDGALLRAWLGGLKDDVPLYRRTPADRETLLRAAAAIDALNEACGCEQCEQLIADAVRLREMAGS